MLYPRIIPCLLVHQKGLVKTVKFDNPKYVGDPINAVKIFKVFNAYTNNPSLAHNQLLSCNKILKEIKNKNSSIKTVSNILNKSLS